MATAADPNFGDFVERMRPWIASRPVAELVLAMEPERPRDGGTSRWFKASEVGRSCGLRGTKLERAIVEGVASGMLERSGLDKSVKVRATALGLQLVGTTTGDGAEVDASGLEGEPHADLVAAVASMPTTMPLAEAVADRLGRDVVVVWDEILEAEGAGLLESWTDHPAGPSVALSPLSARRLGLEPSNDGSIWLAPGQKDPTDFDALGRKLTDTDVTDPEMPSRCECMADPAALEGLDRLALEELAAARVAEAEAAVETRSERPRAIVAPKLSPAEKCLPLADRMKLVKDRQEQARRERLRRLEEGTCRERIAIPAPRIILGMREIWPVYIEMGEACPGCRNEGMGPMAYCALCHRSGLDAILERMERDA